MARAPNKPRSMQLQLRDAIRAADNDLLKTAGPNSRSLKPILNALRDYHSDKKGFAWPSEEQLAQATGTSVSTVKRDLKEVINRKLAIVDRRAILTPHGDGSRKHGSAYTLDLDRLKTLAERSEHGGDHSSHVNSREGVMTAQRVNSHESSSEESRQLNSGVTTAQDEGHDSSGEGSRQLTADQQKKWHRKRHKEVAEEVAYSPVPTAPPATSLRSADHISPDHEGVIAAKDWKPDFRDFTYAQSNGGFAKHQVDNIAEVFRLTHEMNDKKGGRNFWHKLWRNWIDGESKSMPVHKRADRAA